MEFLQSIDKDLLIYGLIGIVILFVIIKLLKLPFKIILNGIFGVVILYIVNLIGANYGITIGINVVTALIAGILGVPGVIALVIFQLFM